VLACELGLEGIVSKRFVIAIISDAKSVQQELQAIVPNIPELPVQPILVKGQEEPGMFDFF
jgi:hypothetical protein